MRLFTLVTAASLSVSAIALAGNAAVARVQSINPAPQSLQVALQTLARERGLQIAYRADLVRGFKAPNVRAKSTTDQALAELLKGTGLTYTYRDRKRSPSFPYRPERPG